MDIYIYIYLQVIVDGPDETAWKEAFFLFCLTSANRIGVIIRTEKSFSILVDFCVASSNLYSRHGCKEK